MNIKKLIKEIEIEYSVEFPFNYEDVSPFEIESSSIEFLEEKMYYYKFLSIITFSKEDIEAYVSFCKAFKKVSV